MPRLIRSFEAIAVSAYNIGGRLNRIPNRKSYIAIDEEDAREKARSHLKRTASRKSQFYWLEELVEITGGTRTPIAFPENLIERRPPSSEATADETELLPAS